MVNRTAGGRAPAGEDWVPKRLREIEVQLQELKAARTLEAASIGAGGLVIRGGALTVLDDDGVIVAEIGKLTDDGPDDSGMRLMRTDAPNAGTVAFRFRGGFIGLKDAAGHNVVSDDITSGRGLGTPWVPLDRPADTNIATWPATSNPTWTAIASCSVQAQNPGFRWSILCQADVGTTGQFRVLIDGSVVATSPPVSGTFAFWDAEYFWPGEWVLNDCPAFDIEAQVTAGAGTVRAQVYQLTGRSS